MGCQMSVPENDELSATIKGIGKSEHQMSKAKREALQEQIEKMKNLPKLNASGQLMDEEVKKRTNSSSANSTMTVGTPGNAIQIEYAYWTQRGYYPDDPHKENQDEFGVTMNLAASKSDALLGIYDGHGAEGHSCSRYCKDELPRLIAKQIRQQRVKRYKEEISKNNNEPSKKLYDPSKWPLLVAKDVETCCRKAYVDCNQNMHDNAAVLDKLSGTTATSVIFHGDLMTICNVGDSRAVLGHRIATASNCARKEDDNNEEKEKESTEKENVQAQTLLAIPLSRDQTPYRKDERDRLKKEGAVIMSIDQMEGRTEMHENWGDLVLGKDVDFHGDPPRVWVDGKDYPGCAFTRAIGDSLAEGIGVNAVPEMLSRKLTMNDEILVLASDGIFEFVTNQEAIKICSDCETPLEACEKLVRAAYDQWLIHEDRTDDITIIVCFLKCSSQPTKNEIHGTTEDLVDLADSFYGTELRNGSNSKNDKNVDVANAATTVSIAIENESNVGMPLLKGSHTKNQSLAVQDGIIPNNK